ncbi:MAG: aldehyde dehydrogenase family protein [Fimbriimonadaceae bacterium]|nr:aldehyde dehydrogenase family protein [Fimbriimonadaceae bacterium]
MAATTPSLSQTDLQTWQSDGRPIPEVRDGLKYLVGGEIKEWGGTTQEIESCLFFTWNGGTVRPKLGPGAMLDPEESMRALAAAEKAWDEGRGEWPTMSTDQRIRAMEKFVERMVTVRDVVVERMMWEIGKTLKDSQNEFDRTVKYIEDTLKSLKDMERDAARFSVETGFFAQIRRSPLGPTLCMGPYNYPLNETFATLIPAVVMGNPVISKLPRYGQLLNIPLLEAFAECFPPGVVNIISGRGNEIITPMIHSGRLSMLAFIGASKTADVLKSAHPHPHRFRSVLSLDAKNPAMILEDADMDVVIPQVIAGALGFNGQRCTALKMMFVHKSREEEFLTRLGTAIDGLKAGHPWTPGVRVTPVADHRGAMKFLGGLIDEAVSTGATVVNRGGGDRVENYMHPAVVHNVSPKTQLYQVEQFGPVLPVNSFEKPEEVMKYIVESPFGQQVSVFGYDPKVIGPVIDVLVNQVSRINLNTQCQRGPDNFPFTGRKASAEGTLSVTDALKRFSLRSLVATDYDERNRDLVNGILAARSSNFLRTDFIF